MGVANTMQKGPNFEMADNVNNNNNNRARPSVNQDALADELTDMFRTIDINEDISQDELVKLCLFYLNQDQAREVKVTADEVADAFESLSINQTQSSTSQSMSNSNSYSGTDNFSNSYQHGDQDMESDFNPEDVTFPVRGCDRCNELWQQIEDRMDAYNHPGSWYEHLTKEMEVQVEEHMLDHMVRMAGGGEEWSDTIVANAGDDYAQDAREYYDY